jgi:hypothetical protein
MPLPTIAPKPNESASPYPNPHQQSPRKQLANKPTKTPIKALAGSREVSLKNLRVDQIANHGTPTTKPIAIITSTMSNTPLPLLVPT